MMSSTAGWSRRQLLASLTAGGATPFLIPSTLRGGKTAAAAGEQITLGLIGLGRLGHRHHLKTFLENPDVRILAVCDVDQWRRENAKAEVEKTYAEAQKTGRYQGCTAYNDFRELLLRDDIDAVVITVGDRWNSVIAVHAARAGKDIYCEKPVSLTIREARTMAEVVRRHERVFQTGLQQRSEPQFRKGVELIRDGAIGKLKIIYPNLVGTSKEVNLPSEPAPEGLDWDLWLGPAPWRPFNRRFHKPGEPATVVPWSFCRDFGGGMLTNSGVHNFDVVQWVLGMDASGPVEITPPGVNGAKSLTFRYANGLSAEVVDWRMDPALHTIPEGWEAGRKFMDFSVLFVGERGWIYVGRQGLLESHPKEIVADWNTYPPIVKPKLTPIAAHHANWIQAVRTRHRTAADAEVGANSTIVAHLGNIAYWTGRALRWDPIKEEFAGDETANRLRARAMREPWTI